MESAYIGMEQIASSSPGSVGWCTYPVFIEPTITRVPSGFSGYIWLDTKIVLKKICKQFYSTTNEQGPCFSVTKNDEFL